MADVSTRRRRWTEAAKRQIVEESLVPGATVVEVARRHGLNTSLLYNWRRHVASVEGKDLATFNPVVVEPEPPTSVPAAGPVIEIVVGAVLIRVDAAVDAGVLHRVMDAARRLT